jgi:aspartyl-tRNA(Asn)/glutamyl-tRNA(Gln) amidotransferase subunit C
VLDGKDIQKLAELSRLEIPAGESADVLAKLSAVVGLVDQLQAVDTAGVEPMAHPMNQTQRLRADLVTEQDRHELYQRNAPLVERDLYLVPKVIE